MLLFVCHANIARSPAAESVARLMLAGRTGWDVASAGVNAQVGSPIDPQVGAALRRRGADVSLHRARQLGRVEILAADLILVFDATQRGWVLEEDPQAFRKTFTLRRAARALSGAARRVEPIGYLADDHRGYEPDEDFPDPSGRGSDAAECAVAEIEAGLRVVLSALGAVDRTDPLLEAPPIRRRELRTSDLHTAGRAR